MKRTYELSRLSFLLAVPLLGCPASSDDGGDDGSSGGIPGTTATPATDDTGSTPATSTSGGGSMTTGSVDTGATTMPPATTNGVDPPVNWDLGIIPDAPPFDDECGKVDFLFVIDNSGSMGNEQASLVASFPSFIQSIQNVLEGVESYQVGIVTTDTYTYNIAGCQALSSLVVQTGGSNSSNAACGPYDAGYNFMTETDDLPVTFSCAAQIGTSGSASERQMQAAVEAVQRVEGDPGECNEGFIRDDALLVIVIITDEPDNASTGTPMTWYDDIVAAKLGIPENIVVVSIINVPGGPCTGGDAPDIAMFTQMFGANGFMANICAPDYTQAFDDAVGIIDIACENFMVPD